MATEIGSKGLAEVNLILPQETSLTFDIVHKDDSDNVIDHSTSVMHMAMQSKDKNTTYVMDSCCTPLSDKIRVFIPASITETLPLGKLNWDIIAATASGEHIRICYGVVNVLDTYALDEE